jgi:hypothetical protein
MSNVPKFENRPHRQYWEESRVGEILEGLYQRSGRAEPRHPMHGLYTGLWQELTGADDGARAFALLTRPGVETCGL